MVCGWCGSQNGHQKDMCLKEIGVSVQNMTLILGLKAIGVGVVVGGMCMGIFMLILNEMFI